MPFLLSRSLLWTYGSIFFGFLSKKQELTRTLLFFHGQIFWYFHGHFRSTSNFQNLTVIFSLCHGHFYLEFSLEKKKSREINSVCKGTVFFFRKKSKGYSLTRFGHFLFFYFRVCFFFRPCFFFSRKSLHATHSTEKIQPAKKGKKKAKNGIFCRFSVFPLIFFLQFFFQDKFTCHSLNQFQEA